MNLVTSQFDKQDRSVEGITARNQVLNKEIDTQKDKIGTLEKALENATSSFGENDRRTKAGLSS
jgi:phage-related minor tail protein